MAFAVTPFGYWADGYWAAEVLEGRMKYNSLYSFSMSNASTLSSVRLPWAVGNHVPKAVGRQTQDFAGLGLSPRDQKILALAKKHLNGSKDFSEAIRALREATEELIPGGQIFVLGVNDRGPIVGSLVSGVAIAQGSQNIELIQYRESRVLLRSFCKCRVAEQ